MKTTSEYIDLIKVHSDELRTQFGVRMLRLFGAHGFYRVTLYWDTRQQIV